LNKGSSVEAGALMRFALRRPRFGAMGLPCLCLALALGAAACSSPDPADPIFHVASAVVGGAPIDASDLSFVGALVQHGPSDQTTLLCTATRIGPRAVLTAAHCLSGRDADLLAFTVSTDLASTGPRDRGVRAFIHPLFVPKAAGDMHDIAILEVAGPPPTDAGVSQAVLLAASAGSAEISEGGSVELVGYGGESPDGAGAGAKNAARTDIIHVDTGEIVVGGPGKPQACFGDSGGPAFVTAADGSVVVAGVVSRSADAVTACIAGTVVTRVDAHADWIERTTDVIAAGGAGSPGSTSCSAVPTARAGGDGWVVLAFVTGIAARRARSKATARTRRRAATP
jgi:secreted trypsin-like serine protease